MEKSRNREPQSDAILAARTSARKKDKPAMEDMGYADCGTFSRYFDLDSWWRERLNEMPPNLRALVPFLVVPKPSQGEKDEGCEDLPIGQLKRGGGLGKDPSKPNAFGSVKAAGRNIHPTCKPLKLMAWLVTLGSMADDLVLDPFLGSGTTAVACKLLKRFFLGIERDPMYYTIARSRIDAVQERLL